MSPLPIFVPHAELDRLRHADVSHCGADGSADSRYISWVDDLKNADALHLTWFVSERSFDRRAFVTYGACRVNDGNDIRCILQQSPEVFLALLVSVLRQPAFRDV